MDNPEIRFQQLRSSTGNVQRNQAAPAKLKRRQGVSACYKYMSMLVPSCKGYLA